MSEKTKKDLLYLLLPIIGAFILIFVVCCCGRKVKEMLHFPKEFVLGHRAVNSYNSDSDNESEVDDVEDDRHGNQSNNDNEAVENARTHQNHIQNQPNHRNADNRNNQSQGNTATNGNTVDNQTRLTHNNITIPRDTTQVYHNTISTNGYRANINKHVIDQNKQMCSNCIHTVENTRTISTQMSSNDLHRHHQVCNENKYTGNGNKQICNNNTDKSIQLQSTYRDMNVLTEDNKTRATHIEITVISETDHNKNPYKDTNPIKIDSENNNHTTMEDKDIKNRHANRKAMKIQADTINRNDTININADEVINNNCVTKTNLEMQNDDSHIINNPAIDVHCSVKTDSTANFADHPIKDSETTVMCVNHPIKNNDNTAIDRSHPMRNNEATALLGEDPMGIPGNTATHVNHPLHNTHMDYSMQNNHSPAKHVHHLSSGS